MTDNSTPALPDPTSTEKQPPDLPGEGNGEEWDLSNVDIPGSSPQNTGHQESRENPDGEGFGNENAAETWGSHSDHSESPRDTSIDRKDERSNISEEDVAHIGDDHPEHGSLFYELQDNSQENNEVSRDPQDGMEHPEGQPSDGSSDTSNADEVWGEEHPNGADNHCIEDEFNQDSPDTESKQNPDGFSTPTDGDAEEAHEEQGEIASPETAPAPRLRSPPEIIASGTVAFCETALISAYLVIRLLGLFIVYAWRALELFTAIVLIPTLILIVGAAIGPSGMATSFGPASGRIETIQYLVTTVVFPASIIFTIGWILDMTIGDSDRYSTPDRPKIDRL